MTNITARLVAVFGDWECALPPHPRGQHNAQFALPARLPDMPTADDTWTSTRP